MSDLVARFYHWLWRDCLKLPKPITHITRDDTKENPLLYIITALLLGVALVKFSKDKWYLCLIWLLIGIILGHIYW